MAIKPNLKKKQPQRPMKEKRKRGCRRNQASRFHGLCFAAVKQTRAFATLTEAQCSRSLNSETNQRCCCLLSWKQARPAKRKAVNLLITEMEDKHWSMWRRITSQHEPELQSSLRLSRSRECMVSHGCSKRRERNDFLFFFFFKPNSSSKVTCLMFCKSTEIFDLNFQHFLPRSQEKRTALNRSIAAM